MGMTDRPRARRVDGASRRQLAALFLESLERQREMVARAAARPRVPAALVLPTACPLSALRCGLTFDAVHRAATRSASCAPDLFQFGGASRASGSASSPLLFSLVPLMGGHFQSAKDVEEGCPQEAACSLSWANPACQSRIHSGDLAAARTVCAAPKAPTDCARAASKQGQTARRRSSPLRIPA
jgi:hypothetical protein